MTSDDHDRDEEDRRREDYESWVESRRRGLVERLLEARPPVYSTPGDLDSRLAKWADDLADPLSPGKGLILTGPVGVGKTWALWHAAERAVRAGFAGGICFVQAGSFRRAVAPATTDPAVFGKWKGIGLLILDDLGSPRLSEWDLDNLHELTHARWEYQLPTAVASNFHDLRSLLGERVASRLAAGAVKVKLAGEDRRRR